jgi:ERCC4-related helicase
MPSEPKYKIDDTLQQIHQRDIVGFVRHITYSQGIYWYRLRLFDGRVINFPEQDLELFSQVLSAYHNFVNKTFSTRESFSRILTFIKLIGGYLNNPTSLMSLKTIFKAHQYKPLLKFLYSGNQRLLIADEVGLGKTIEAGYILSELNAKNPLKFVLVICPKSLCIKWERELSDKFSFYFDILSKPQLLRILNEQERGNTGRRVHGIISYQTARNKTIREKLREVNPSIDLIIFDEMHWTRNETSQTNKLARIVSELSDSVIGLTATPIMIGSKNLFNLLSILNPFEFQNEKDFDSRLEDNKHVIKAINWIGRNEYLKAHDELINLENNSYTQSFRNSPLYQKIKNDLNTKNVSVENTINILRDATELSLLSHIVTRTRRKEVELKCIRRAQTFKLEFTEIEKLFYNEVTNFIRRRYKEFSGNRGTSFATMMPQRQIASCIPAMIKSYLNNEDFLENILKDQETIDVSENGTDITEENENQKNKVRSEVTKLLLTLSKDPFKLPDTKYDELKKILHTIFTQESNSKILIFTYFKGTLSYLSKKLFKDGFHNYCISGDIVAEERQELLDKFRNENNIRIMVSTEVGSEGIDLEFCTTLINYDLPWNPMVVEQRIGRLDRFGQKADAISIINFAVEETIEARILERLYERIKIFEESIGDLESILGEEIKKLSYELLSKQLTKEEEERYIDRVAEVVLNEKIFAEKLEEESAGLITNDEYFHRELEAILSEKRYITHEELIIYINEFLKNRFPECILKQTEDIKIFKIYLSPELEAEIKILLREINLMDDKFILFTNKANKLNERVIKITFDNEVARLDRTIEMINAYHPVVIYITEKLKREKTYLPPCSAVTIDEYSNLSKGIYFYFTFELDISGGRSYKTLTHIILNNDDIEVLDEHNSAELMAKVLVEGKTFDYRNEEYEFDAEKKYQVAEDIHYSRLEKIKSEAEVLNEGNIQKQLDVLNKVFENRVGRIKETIDTVQNDARRKRIIPALEGKIEKLVNEKDQKLQEIMSKRQIHSNTNLITAGILNIES